jgi:hypothetical protein
MPTDRDRLERFIAKYSPDIVRVARGVLPALRKWFAGTQELVYDNYNALVIAWSPTGKVGDIICSIALYPRWVTLFFARGAALPDPERRLRGSGKAIRHVVLERGKATLAEPAVKRLLSAAVDAAVVAPSGRGTPVTTIKSIVAKQRPRRPPVTDSRRTRSPSRSARA